MNKPLVMTPGPTYVHEDVREPCNRKWEIRMWRRAFLNFTGKHVKD